MKKTTDLTNPTTTSKHDLVQTVFPSCTNARVRSPYGLNIDRRCMELDMKLKLLHGTASQASPRLLTLRSKANALMKPKTKPRSCIASLATSKPCLSQCFC